MRKTVSVVLDTDTLILLVKNKKLVDFVSMYDAYITIITEYEYVRGEVRVGIDPNESKETLEESFNILYFDNKSVEQASLIWAKLSSEGLLIDERDLIIGSICIANKLPLWTLNKKHFERLKRFGLKLVDIDIETLRITRIS